MFSKVGTLRMAVSFHFVCALEYLRTHNGRIRSLAGPTEVLLASGKQTQWLDYLPSPALALTATSTFCAVAMQDGSVNVYSPTGRRYVLYSLTNYKPSDLFYYIRIMPTLSIGSPCSSLSSSKNCLMLLTTSGVLHVW